VTILGILIALVGLQPALAQEAEQPDAAQEAEEPAATEEEPEEEFMDVIEVVGFRQSLQQSVALKRDAINVRDSIVTEDIGKMPDLNLAEAIQRVPGVAITREGGEGRQISLRGLGASFTRVTLNGMEVPSSVAGLDSAGGINRGRAFDFNVFPAELFSPAGTASWGSRAFCERSASVRLGRRQVACPDARGEMRRGVWSLEGQVTGSPQWRAELASG
jgi:hypothetical protein